MKTVLVSRGLSDDCRAFLEGMGYRIVLLPPFERLQKAVSSHADMLVFFDRGRLITHADYYNENREIFDGLSCSVELSGEPFSAEYPRDVLFNAVLTKSRMLFSRTEYTSSLITRRATEMVKVKQGYTACSTCRVTDNAFITSDEGLFKAYSDRGIDALFVPTDGIDLPGYDCGFIGGASLVLDDCVGFFGRVDRHPAFEAITSFVMKHGKRVVSLSNEKLTDIGGAVVI